MANMYYEKDCDLSKLDGKKIGIIGYARQPESVQSGGRRCAGYERTGDRKVGRYYYDPR